MPLLRKHLQRRRRFEGFSYHIDNKAKRLADMMDGKLLLVTNAAGLAAQNVIQRYKSLADIECDFKVLNPCSLSPESSLKH